VDSSQVFLASFELSTACGEQFCGHHRVSEVRDEERCKCDIEGQDWFNAMCHVEGRVARRFADCCAVGPEGQWCESRPSFDITVACFDEGLTNSPVLAFDDPIRLRIVSRNTDVTNPVPVCKPF
jgi:hypothetical protein